MKGRLYYGFPVTAKAVESVMREEFGDEEQELDTILYSCLTECRCAAMSSSPLYQGVRGDIQILDVPDHPLYGVVIGMATNESLKSRILPRETEIARLKKVLQTDAESEWFPIA